MAYDTIEEKLRALAECGIKLQEQFDVLDLVELWGREALDKPGFDLTLVCLGMTEDNTQCTPYCLNLWHFDTECIEGDGSYVDFAKRMMEMTRGALPLSDFEDHVDLEGGRAWLRFNCQGTPVHIDCEVQDDWVDINIVGIFVELLAMHDPSQLFVFYDLEGQDCIIGCVPHHQFEKLKLLIPAFQPFA